MPLYGTTVNVTKRFKESAYLGMVLKDRSVSVKLREFDDELIVAGSFTSVGRKETLNLEMHFFLSKI